MPSSLDALLQQWTASGLFSAADVSALLAGLPEAQRPRDERELADELVRRQILTGYQAEQIQAGRGATLMLGNYVILDRIGQGGMGLVFKARHRRMDRIVALKVMSPSAMSSPDAVARFQREVRAAARLTHPNIVIAFDADESNGTHFLVMEYVAGTNLSEYVKRHGPLPLDRAMRCVLQAARGLECAHEHGVLHRDIKPSNLLLLDETATTKLDTADGTGGSSVIKRTASGSQVIVKVLDMGLARIESALPGEAQMTELTDSGTLLGTIDYMAPEQALDTKLADARSDVYSLGCTLHYLLTGAVVYDGSTAMKKLIAHRDAPVPSLQERLATGESPTLFDARKAPTTEIMDPDQPATLRDDALQLAALDSLFRRMIAKNPDERPQTMTEVIADLECCLNLDSNTICLKSPFQKESSAAIQLFLDRFIREMAQQSEAGIDAAPESATAKPDSTAGGNRNLRPPSAAESPGSLSDTMPLLSRESLRAPSSPQQPSCFEQTVIGVPTFDPVVRPAGAGRRRRVWLAGLAGLLLLALFFAMRQKPGESTASSEADANATPAQTASAPGQSPGAVQAAIDPAEQPATGTPPEADSTRTEASSAPAPASPFALEFQLGAQVVSAPLPLPESVVCTLEVWTYILDEPPRPARLLSGPNAAELDLDQRLFRFSTFHGHAVTEPIAEPGRWYHVAGVNDGRERRLYLNGRLVGRNSTAGEISPERKALPIQMGLSVNDAHWLIAAARFSRVARYDQDFVPPARFATDQDTVALYDFDQGQGNVLRDLSGNNHHAEIIGATWLDLADGLVPAKPLVRSALQFEGQGSYAELPDLPRPADKPFTVEARVLHDDSELRLSFKGPDDVLQVIRRSGQFMVVNQRNSDGAMATGVTTSLNPEPGKWVHLAAVHEAGQWRLFADGQPLSVSPIRLNLPKIWRWPSSLGFAGDREFGRRPLGGVVESVRVSSEARYREAFQPPGRMIADPATLALYHCDEGRGATLRDSSGNHRHGTLHNTRWLTLEELAPLPAAPEQAVDLLSLVDLSRDVQQGKWEPGTSGFQALEMSVNNVLRLPVIPGPEYSVRTTFATTRSNFSIILPVGDSGLEAGCTGGRVVFKLNGLAWRDGLRSEELPASLSDGRPHELQVDVSSTESGQVRIQALVDGRLWLEWKGAHGEFQAPVDLPSSLPCLAVNMFLTNAEPAKLLSAQLISKRGSVQVLRSKPLPVIAPADDAEPVSAVPLRNGQLKVEPADGWVDLTPLIDPARDTLADFWKKDSDGFLNEGTLARLRMPARTTGNYECRLVFTLLPNRPNMFGCVMPVGNRHAMLKIDSVTSAGMSLANWSFQSAKGNYVPLSESPIQPGHEHSLLIRVVAEGDQLHLQSEVDGTGLVAFQGPVSLLASDSVFEAGALDEFVISARKGQVKLHRFEWRQLTGEARLPDPG